MHLLRDREDEFDQKIRRGEGEREAKFETKPSSDKERRLRSRPGTLLFGGPKISADPLAQFLGAHPSGATTGAGLGPPRKHAFQFMLADVYFQSADPPGHEVVDERAKCPTDSADDRVHNGHNDDCP